VLKKVNRNSREDDAVDVPADNPTGTMRRFTDGLKRVIHAKKPGTPRQKPKRR